MPRPSRKRQISSCHQLVLYPLPIAGPRMNIAEMAMGTLRPMNLSESGSDSQQPLYEDQGLLNPNDERPYLHKTGRKIRCRVDKSKLPGP